MIILLVKYRVTDGINITYQSEEIMKFEKDDDICTDSIKKKCFFQPNTYYRGARIILDEITRV
jgi:hypothetical protein